MLTIGAEAADIDPQYGVGTSNLTLFSGIAEKLPYGTHYVYWRESQYEYCLFYSESLQLSDGLFTAPEGGTEVTYTTAAGYQSQATYTTTQYDMWSLDPGYYLVYSDLGDYPTLYERGERDYAELACVILCSIVLYYLWHHLWADIRQRFVSG